MLSPGGVAREFAEHGYVVDSDAAELLADRGEEAVGRALEYVGEETLRVSVETVRTALEDDPADTTASTGGHLRTPTETATDSPGETVGREATGAPGETVGREATGTVGEGDGGGAVAAGRSPAEPQVAGDVTGRSTGTGEYSDFVTLFQDRYERLSRQLRGRVNARPTTALDSMPGGDAAVVGMVNDIRSTANGHWLVELEDTTGTFPCLFNKDRELADAVDELLLDEVVGVEGTVADDGGVLFVDELHVPDVPRTHSPSTADRHVQAALVSDLHVGSQEFTAAAWESFVDWLHGASAIEYLLIAGDMVEGVGVYPDQDEELDVVDIYEQYEAFADRLAAVPSNIEVVMIPGNHDAVRLAEPQPAFDEELREVLSVDGARIVGNPSTVTIEGVTVLLYHGVSLDEVVAEIPAASYEAPHEAMYRLLEKRHLAPQFGSHVRVAPESEDYLVIDEVPDVFHAGHVHKLGAGRYHNVTVVNSGCWQSQTAFQRANNIDPDAGCAAILDLDTLDVTLRKFG